ncbi:cation:proton antiporter [Alkalihalobacillus alcalophilus ATCC 27647 = CGMCC 1.3604]|uniref:Cation:proton antiporter n=1 Tax=Alkalihalobacillus alcalophilus ATCC 27647 = CGMCC 1.3604 TaxID=1218173 RepID=J8T8A9_ALKAL|nr:Na+/H+ antiporter subunit E [Alkalihalobacillus alcalophilus]AFV25873.1 multicomponent sodium ion:proton antiporter transporter [Alkalihalobacillus alcalophilus ATCC 27647 = CGMCC 1.3604]KGA97129.1 monovalent cation/H+ antiporter subunit E [Alkalihalobacillus alcalophilus ATCC 27647 = CGMCC 1.3604]MED1560599.1 Na+/H+ antiporter subunit E [Alkalihalobacillus alcalophilus]THG89075.1 cation:proton antiporter [Alkalihalobacillus alcalophilus ATCC 27647 = CGMCC 1.3604]
MAFQILLNLLIAFAWVNFQHSYTSVDFLVGYIIGIFILFFLRRFMKFDFYMRRVWALIKLAVLFFVELIKANIDVLRVVLKPKLDNQPGIIAVPTKLTTDWEVSLLAALISLTPGTLSMDFSQDGKYIYVHALDIPNKEQMVRDIHDTFERAIMEVTRGNV